MLKDVILYISLGLGLGLALTVIIQLSIINQKITQFLLMFFQGQTTSSSGTPGSGQTINVNIDREKLAQELAAMGVSPNIVEQKPGTNTEIAVQQPVQNNADVKREEKKAEKEKQAQEKREERNESTTTNSGVAAIICPKCGGENSSFRRECFNCNNPL